MQQKHKPTEVKGINEGMRDQEREYTHVLNVYASWKDYENYVEN